MRKNIGSLVLILFMLVSTNLLAIPAAPVEMELRQPDGTTFTAIPRGDEYANWIETVDGHSIIRVDDTWYYAENDGAGGLRATAIPVGSLDARQLQSMPLHLAPTPHPDISKPRTIRKLPRVDISGREAETGEGLAAPHTQYLLTILVSYSDIASMGYPDSAFASLVYGSTASVKHFFLENSYNQFIVTPAAESKDTANDGIIHIYRPIPHPNQGNTHDTSRAEARAIVNSVNSYVNFASYDADGDGSVTADELSIMIILAGYEAGYAGIGVSPTPNVWGHQAYFSSELTLDGKILSPYTMFGAAHAYDADPAGKHIATIGVMTHELGHLMFGLPDLYDADQPGPASSKGIGDWGLMGGGAWNSLGLYSSFSPVIGDLPSHLSAWSKVATGFSTPQDIIVNQNGVSIPRVETSEGIKRIWADKYKVSEYFLLENRQQTGYDLKIPGNGLLIWHIDESITDNNDETHKWVDLEEADGQAHLDSKTNNGDTGDSFPGSTTNRTFNNSSNPNSKFYSNAATGISVTSISNSSTTMSANIAVASGGLGDHVRYDSNGFTAGFSFSNSTAWIGNRTLNDTENHKFDGVDVFVEDPTGATIDIIYYSSMARGTPTGEIHRQVGFDAVPGWNRLLLATPQPFPVGSERGIVVKVVTDNVGSGSQPVTIDHRGPVSGRGYYDSNGSGTFSPMCDALCSDLNLVALLSGANTAPTFTPAPAISRTAGSPAGSPEVVGSVTDADTAAGDLTVVEVPSGTTAGLTIGGVTNTNGTVTATVAAACDASTGQARFKVNDGDMGSTGDLLVNVLGNPAPTLSYSNRVIGYGGSDSVSPDTGPSDNVSVDSLIILSKSGYTGTMTISPAGVVSISNAKPVGTHTIALRVRDNCDVLKDASFDLQVDALVPGAPTIGFAVAGGQQADVSFTPPLNNGGATITSYTATSSPGGLTGTGSGSPVTVNGLTNGVKYTFNVTAENTAGNGSASNASNAITPMGSQTITFNNPGPQNFGTTPTLIATSSSGLTPYFGSGTVAVCTITEAGALTFLTTGSCSIDAKLAGTAAYHPAATINQTFNVNAVVPGAPVIGVASAGNIESTVSFTPPAFTGGAAISSYTVTSNPGGISAGGTVSPITVNGLTNDVAYTFTVTANNPVGSGPASAVSNSVTPRVKPLENLMFSNGFERPEADEQ